MQCPSCTENMHHKLFLMQYPSQTIMFLELYHCLGCDGYCIYLTYFFKVDAIPIMHQKHASQNFFVAIPITNHNVFSILSLFGSRWVLHILDLFFQSRCNTHHAPKRCITNFHGMQYPSQPIMFLEIYHCLFCDGYCIFDLTFQSRGNTHHTPKQN